MQIIAITGSIGCGKTTIAGMLKRLGHTVYDVDKWCRSLYDKPDFLARILQVFPQTYVNGKFSKKILRQIVFNDHQELKKLEEMTHPFLKRQFLKTIRRNRFYNHIMFVDVAILFEMGWAQYCTSVIVADAPYAVQKKRVMERDKISAEDFERIVATQMDNGLKKKMADYVVNTDQTEGRLIADLIRLTNGLEKC